MIQFTNTELIYLVLSLLGLWIFILVFKSILKRRRIKIEQKNWSIIERKPIGKEKGRGGWYARHNWTGRTTNLFSNEQELRRNLR